MTDMDEISADLVRSIVDANFYMTLGTADEQGNAWASPVWYATDDYHEFVWLSAPQARHSRNLAVRPELGIVIFDSRQPPGTGQGVYLEARAEQVADPDLERCLDLFSTVSRRQGLTGLSRAEVEPPVRLRLYRATVTAHFVLSASDQRLPVDLR
jgi:nitroimidazol reductase NimA-like FMN-containing flavoprotein (pyridoxamine 5'-phosphate oxidase superfamily)